MVDKKNFKQVVGLKDFVLIVDINGSTKELPLVQAFNIVFSDTKTPIWDFATKNFKQVADGKRLVEGTIILKENQIGFIDTTIKEERNTKEIENRTSNYTGPVQSYIKEIIDNYYAKGNTLSDKTKENILKSALKLIETQPSISLLPSSDDTQEVGYSLRDVNFTEVQNTKQITEAGVVMMKFFANWVTV